MVSNLTLETAQTKIEELVETFTKDFKCAVAKRAMESKLEKRIVFGVEVKKENSKGEELFDALSSFCLDELGFVDVKSEAFVENRTVKEVYAITAIVKIKIS